MPRQFNVPLSERYALVLGEVALRDECSVPEVLRPVIERFLDEALASDGDLRDAVESLERSRRRRRSAARVATLTPRDDQRSDQQP